MRDSEELSGKVGYGLCSRCWNLGFRLTDIRDFFGSYEGVEYGVLRSYQEDAVFDCFEDIGIWGRRIFGCFFYVGEEIDFGMETGIKCITETNETLFLRSYSVPCWAPGRSEVLWLL